MSKNKDVTYIQTSIMDSNNNEITLKLESLKVFTDITPLIDIIHTQRHRIMELKADCRGYQAMIAHVTDNDALVDRRIANIRKRIGGCDQLTMKEKDVLLKIIDEEGNG